MALIPYELSNTRLAQLVAMRLAGLEYCSLSITRIGMPTLVTVASRNLSLDDLKEVLTELISAYPKFYLFTDPPPPNTDWGAFVTFEPEGLLFIRTKQ